MIYPPQNELRIIYHQKILHSSAFCSHFLLFQLPGAQATASLPDGVGLTSPDVLPGITSCEAASLPPILFGASLPAQQHHFMKCFSQPCVRR